MTEEMSRRSTLQGAAVFAVGGVAGAIVASGRDDGSGNAQANAYGDAETSTSTMALAAVDDIPAGGGVILSEAEVVLVKADDGTVSAYSSICTHQGCPVSEVTGGEIVCPCHASTFDAATGEVTGGPAGAPLPTLEVTVKDGEVFLA